ncbi:MAG: hypothetical protein ACP5O3_04245 [Candidatus Micrarchaeia archaeon]
MVGRQLFSASRVKSLVVSSRVLGAGFRGVVRLGRIKFEGGKSFGVAVKEFRKPLSGEEVAAYEKVIRDLREAGVRVPKMGFVDFGGRKVLVSELFAKGKRSKLVDAEVAFKELGSEGKKDFVELVARLLGRGYVPFTDSIAFVRTSSGFKPVVHDLDLFVELGGRGVAFQLRKWLDFFEPRERLGVIGFLLERVSRPDFRKQLLALKEEKERELRAA